MKDKNLLNRSISQLARTQLFWKPCYPKKEKLLWQLGAQTFSDALSCNAATCSLVLVQEKDDDAESDGEDEEKSEGSEDESSKKYVFLVIFFCELSWPCGFELNSFLVSVEMCTFNFFIQWPMSSVHIMSKTYWKPFWLATKLYP